MGAETPASMPQRLLGAPRGWKEGRKKSLEGPVGTGVGTLPRPRCLGEHTSTPTGAWARLSGREPRGPADLRAPLHSPGCQFLAELGDQAASFVPRAGRAEGTESSIRSWLAAAAGASSPSPSSLSCACYTTDLRIIQRAGSAGGTELSCLPGPLKLGVGGRADGTAALLLPRA